MKKLSVLSVAIILMVFGFQPVVHSVETLSLSNEYNVYLYCMDDAGDYCDGNEIISDKFYFDDDEFTTEWFEEKMWGYNEPGEYDDGGSSFSGEYEVYDENAEKYEIEFRGISLVDNIIIGSMNIKYLEWDFLKFDFEEEDDAEIYFLGISD
jgi:hypothetical protein